jgi:hypothetical protein
LTFDSNIIIAFIDPQFINHFQNSVSKWWSLARFVNLKSLPVSLVILLPGWYVVNHPERCEDSVGQGCVQPLILGFTFLYIFDSFQERNGIDPVTSCFNTCPVFLCIFFRVSLLNAFPARSHSTLHQAKVHFNVQNTDPSTGLHDVRLLHWNFKGDDAFVSPDQYFQKSS